MLVYHEEHGRIERARRAIQTRGKEHQALVFVSLESPFDLWSSTSGWIDLYDTTDSDPEQRHWTGARPFAHPARKAESRFSLIVVS